MTKIKVCPPVLNSGSLPMSVVVLRDVGGPSDKSITNDIENVVAEMAGRGVPTRGVCHFFYYDSEGELTGVNVINGKFGSFFSPNTLYRNECAEPDAKWVACCVCDRPVKTCELAEPVGDNYLCPAHSSGAELNDGRWVCSDECFERVITLGDDDEAM